MDPQRNAATRFAALSALFDAATQRHLSDRGLVPGWRCLEVGGGGGSVATWLAERVGPTGHVVATDIDTAALEGLDRGNLEVRRHDITCDPLPDRAFDLIHTRMVLLHLPERDRVMSRLVQALKPGGWLVCEEFDRDSVPADPRTHPGEVALKTHAAMGKLHDDRGVASRYGRQLFTRMRAAGLVDVGAEARLVMARPRSWATTLLRASYEQRRHAMIDAGYVTAVEFDTDLARMEDDDFVMPSPLLWSAWGCRPQETPCTSL